MNDGGRQHKPGTPAAGEPGAKPAEDPSFVPHGRGQDRSWPLTDPMRFVRYERQQASQQIGRSMKAWRAAKPSGAPSAAAKIPQSSGSPLPNSTRQKMEQHLGADLSEAKINTGRESEQAAESMKARAFTAGKDVHFGAGEFNPGTKEGDRLLAHELTHVVQGGGLEPGRLISRAAKTDEKKTPAPNAATVGGAANLKYVPSPKHAPGGWGTPMDLDDATAQRLLNESIASGKQRYNYINGKLYEFQPDNAGGWHGYPIPGTEAPSSVRKALRDAGKLTQAEYKKLTKGEK